MNKYKSGYLVWSEEVANELLKGSFFRVKFSKQIKDKHEQELIICSKNIENARKASQLINAAMSLQEGYTFFPSDSIPPLVPCNTNDKNPAIFNYKVETISTSGFFDAAKIASKASFRNKYYYALVKYQLGCELHSNNLMDLYPQYFKLSRNPADHIRIGYGIILFYSVIEQLGLEIRASNQVPSLINSKWNPVVKNDLQKRLLDSKININQTIDWNFRSTPTRIEKTRKPEVGKKSNWSYGNVRDSKINIIDAIAYASWLRSKIASHKTTDKILSLSIYDAANLNFLARQLILESMGFIE